MITHKIKFQGRKIGAIGKLQIFRETIQLNSPDEDKAVSELYKKYEHINVLNVDINEAQRAAYWKKERIEKHIAAIGKLVDTCGGSTLQPATVSNRLRSIEHFANIDANKYCEGEISTDEWDTISEKYERQVQKLFNGNLKGLMINGDARGYALKISDELLKPGGIYENIGLQMDWGGYGLLAPTIE